MISRPRIADDQRRARLVRRHHLGRTAADPGEVVRDLVALHSSDPVTPHLAMRARIAGFRVEDLHRCLYDDRTLWRLHAMRRTLFIVQTGEAAMFGAAAGKEVAARERRRLERWLSEVMEAGRIPSWLHGLESRVLDALGGGRELRTQQLTAAVPELGTEIQAGSGRWTAASPVSSRLLFLMAMDGRLVRTRPAGTWRSSQYHWAEATSWFGSGVAEMDPGAGRASLARRYLAQYGPATLVDLRWWTGWTVARATAALEAVDAVPVALDAGREGFVLPGDVDPHLPEPPSVALLPGLDPTPMGWKDREWYVGGLEDQLFDRNGNVGPTIWVGGQVVGGWGQRRSGEIVYRLLVDPGAEASTRVAEEAASLGDWLGGVAVTPRFRTPLERAIAS